MSIVILYPVVFAREGSFFIIGDNLHQSYTFLNKLSIALHKGYLPVWDANTFGGKNFPGELQAGIFYPLNILWCLIFGTPAGIDVYYLDLLVALHYFICLIGMYSLATLLQMPAVAAIGAALTFTFTGILANRSGCETNIFEGLALLPWVIYFLCKYYWRERRKVYLVCAGLMAGLQILAGHLQPFFHALLIAVIVIIFYEYRRRENLKSFFFSAVFNFCIILLVAILISLPQVYYAAEYMSRCYREVGGAGDVYIGPHQKVPLYVYLYRFILRPSDFENLIGQKSILLADFNFVYMGILPFFLCILFLIKSKFLTLTDSHSDFKKLLIIIFTVGILSVLGYLTFFPYILYAIPFANTVRELSRYVILISFSDALLAGLALTYITQLGDQLLQHSSKTNLYVVGALALNALYWLLFQQKNISLDVSVPFLFGFIFLLLLMTVPVNDYIRVLAIAFIFLDLFLNPLNYGPTNSIFYPTRFYSRNKIVNFLESTYGKYRVTFDMDVWAMTRRNLGDVYNVQTKFGYCATVNQSYYNFIYYSKDSEIDDLLNVRYVITDKLLGSNFIFRDSTRYLNLYERRNYYPRCYWKHQLGERGTEIEGENKGIIRQLTYADQYQKWLIHCNSPDTLVFSENDYPGWKCYDNQKEITIYEPTIKNYPRLFRCITLDKGQHIIEFTYNKVFYWF